MDKAGLGLLTEDILDDYCSVKAHEAGFYHVPLEMISSRKHLDFVTLVQTRHII